MKLKLILLYSLFTLVYSFVFESISNNGMYLPVINQDVNGEFATYKLLK